MEKSEILYLEIRRKLFNYIKDNPGLHLHELARNINMNYHNLRYHIRHLEKHDMVVLKTNNYYTHVYPKENLSKREKEILNIIRQETPRNMLLIFINYLISSQNDLSEMLDKHPTTIEYHLKKLKKVGLIQNVQSKDGKVHLEFKNKYIILRSKKINEKIYAINDFSLIIHVFLNYRKSLEKDEIFKFCLERWLEAYNRAIKKNRRVHHDFKDCIDDRVDIVINILFDIFPSPYII